MSKRPRRHHSPEQKAALLKRHLVDKIPVSQLCNENDLQPSVFYDWLRQLLERAPAAFAAPDLPGFFGPRIPREGPPRSCLRLPISAA